ncbi:MAG: DNA mismatch repair endonuclease MutL [Anaerovoracaceae bacterium]
MIKVLEKDVAAKIAAGEVVERPISIVKELVENSIDAQSNEITIEIKNGGKTYIRVTDNGTGINSSEVEIAFFRHATSKLNDIDDLDTLISLGFRGEALASIASVTRTELITKTKEESTGTKLNIDGGHVTSKSPIGCPNGTTIIVRDLFYNTPARMKFMKTDRAEAGVIIDFVSQIALAYPNIKIRMINNENVLFSTNGKGDRHKAIITTTSKAMAENLIAFKEDINGVTVEGYISNPGETKANRRNQIFFVNGRVINSKVIEKGINEGYYGRLFEGRHPVAFLFLNISPETMDVNIHPNKKEIRFYDESVISKAVKDAIIKTLNTIDGIPQVEIKKETGYFKFEKDINGQRIIRNSISNEATSYQEGMILNEKQQDEIPLRIDKAVDTDSKIITNEINVEKHIDVDKDVKTAIDVNVKTLEEDDVTKLLSTYNEGKSKPKEDDSCCSFKSKNEFIIRPFDIESLKPIGQLFGTYIQAVDHDTLYIMDQHAAHERIFFEKFISEYNRGEIPKQTILLPFTFTGSFSFANSEKLWIEELKKLGFEVENFGPNIYKVTEIPMYFGLSEAEEFIKDFVDSYDDIKDFKDIRTRDKIATKACKAAVKANDVLSDEEIKHLFIDLSKCENPFSCPHGRPTFIKLTNYEIEKKFKRK